MHNPRLLLLDEPTAGVDPKARREFWDAIHDLSDQGVTVLVSTHYMDEAERCHRIVYIMDGEILADGTIGELLENAGLHTFTVRAATSHSCAWRSKAGPVSNKWRHSVTRCM